jgi:hypothetical protein
MGNRTEAKPFKSLFQKLEWAFLLLGNKASGFSDTFLKRDPFSMYTSPKEKTILN